MASKLEICNRALFAIGSARIDDFLEQSPEAAGCRMVFDGALNTILRANTWSFATKREALTLVAGPVPVDWMYQYAYPTDCIRLIEVLPKRSSAESYPVRYHNGLGLNTSPMGDTIPFDLELAEGDIKVILTNMEDAAARYTRRIVNVELLDDLAADALKWRLAAELAKSLKGDSAIIQFATQSYAETIQQAAALTKKEAQIMPTRQSTLIGARRGRRYQ